MKGRSPEQVAREAWRRIGALGGVAAGLALVALIAVAPGLWGMLRAWWTPSPSAFVADGKEADKAEQQAAGFDEYLKQIEGRSLFYVPGKPGENGIAPVEEVAESTDENATRYEGPSITAIVLGEVWFDDGRKVKTGVTDGDIEVISTDAPWEARVKWRGGEFTVPFFERDKVVIRDVAEQPTPAPAEGAADNGEPDNNSTEGP